MTEQIISDITLEYLMNKRQYEKYIGKNVVSKKEPNRKDKKFYKKRIVDLTKRLLINEKPEKMFPDVSSIALLLPKRIGILFGI